MNCTDYLRLGEHKIFENVRQGISKDCAAGKTKSLMTVKDDFLYVWNQQDSCILALNVKAARSKDGDAIIHQTLLPGVTPLFSPRRVLANDINTLLAVFGADGVLVFELPPITPPFGTFLQNKEMIYCRSHSLQERNLAFTSVEVQQVRFHPGSPNSNHLCLLTNDNIFRVYCIENGTVELLAVHQIGPKVGGKLLSTRITMQELFGEIAEDFDFGPPQSSTSKDNNKETLKWPAYFVTGDARIYLANIELEKKEAGGRCKGPFAISPLPQWTAMGDHCCSLMVIPSTPTVLVVATFKGQIYHVVLLEEAENARGFLLFESLELELSFDCLGTADALKCAMFLHRDDAKLGTYFATHEAGVHAVNVDCVDSLHKFLLCSEEAEEKDQLQEVANCTSKIEYLLCSKIGEQEDAVIGFALVYNPHSFLALLASGQFVSLPIVTMALPSVTNFDEMLCSQAMNSPLKNMLSNPFDVQIQRILKQQNAQPILKLPKSDLLGQQERYDLFKKTAAGFREQILRHERAAEEIVKRVKALRMLKDFQRKEIDRMLNEKVFLQQNVENLAEKYEDLKDKLEELTKRCENVMILICKQQSVSQPENDYHLTLKKLKDKLEKYLVATEKLAQKKKYQEIQMTNWKEQTAQAMALGTPQSETVKAHLQEMTRKIAAVVKDVHECSKQLNLP